MSTLRTTNLQNPSAASPNIVLGSTGSVAVAGAMTGAGMDLIATQTFSAASTVSFNNVFSSTYDNYRIVVSTGASADGSNLSIRLRLSGTDSTVNYAYQRTSVEGTTFTGSRASSQGSGYIDDLRTSARNTLSIDIFDPSLTNSTTMSALNNDPQGGGSLKIFNVFHTVSTAYDGFTMFPSSGTITGTIRVYGYRNA